MSSLQRYVRDRLPEYMVPAGVVELDRIPLTEHGKIDRAALPDPERSDFGSPSGSEPPRTELERELAAMWGEMLALPDLGVHDDFFMLGGHSMLVTQILFRVRERYGVEVPVRSFMQAPTIAGLAESVELRRIVDDGSSTATLPSAEPRDEMDI
jgi:hypothetical protein